MKVAHKIADVSDEVCEKCGQNWENECRAYCVAHSEEEYEHRKAGGRAACEALAVERLRKKREQKKESTHGQKTS